MPIEAAPSLPPKNTEWWRVLDPFDSLYARILLIFGGGALVFTLLVCVVAGRIFQREIERGTGPSFETLAFQIADKIDKSVADHFHEIQIAANLPEMRSPGAPIADRRSILDAFHDANPDYLWLGFADSSGKIVAGSQHQLEDTLADERDWFRKTTTKPYAGGLHEWPELLALAPLEISQDSTRMMDIAAPVLDRDDKPLGVIGAELTWAAARRAQLSVVPETAKKDRISVTIYAANGDPVLDTGSSFWVSPPPIPDVPKEQRLRGSIAEDATEGAYITGYARSRGYRDFKGVGFFVAVRQPVSRVFAPVEEMQRTIIRWGAGFAVIFVGVGWLFAWRLVRRLRAIGAAAARIHTGDILSLIPIYRNHDATAQMAEALGVMVAGFREKSERLGAEKLRAEAELARTVSPPAGSAQPPRAAPAAERPPKKIYY